MYTIITLLTLFALAQAGELHEAARACDADRMRRLLSRRPSLNAIDENGVTPLHIAIDSRQQECVGLLLKAGADGKARDRKGRTASDAAAQIADPQDRSIILDMLWKSGQTARQEPVGSKPWSLEHSVMRRQTSVTKMLLALGADPNATGSGGTTPLADAALKGDLDGTRVLLAHGARPNTVSQLGMQPIHDAALGDNPEVIRELVKSGANVNARTSDEALTPLHIAATMGKMKAVEVLVALGADLTIKNSVGQTPLETAQRAGLHEAVAFLRRAAAK